MFWYREQPDTMSEDCTPSNHLSYECGMQRNQKYDSYVSFSKCMILILWKYVGDHLSRVSRRDLNTLINGPLVYKMWVNSVDKIKSKILEEQAGRRHGLPGEKALSTQWTSRYNTARFCWQTRHIKKNIKTRHIDIVAELWKFGHPTGYPNSHNLVNSQC